jgi:hypothetical protein
MLPSLDQEAGQSAEEILCDPCFVDAINVAFSPTKAFKAYVRQLHLLYHAKITILEKITREKLEILKKLLHIINNYSKFYLDI